MMNRRGALVAIGFTAFNGMAWSLSNPLRLLQSGTHTFAAFGPQPQSTIDDRLRADLARLAPRVYSEEGIPVLLACENLVPSKDAHKPAKVTLTALNAAFASALHRNAEAFQRIRPDAQAKDVAPLIEVLADRDFTHGGTKEEK